jgi:hypothetical protein
MNPTSNDVSVQGENPLAKKSKFKLKINKLTISLALSCLLVITIIVLILTGILYIGFKSSSQQIVVRTIACDEKIINDFADIPRAKYGIINKNDFTDIADRVKNTPNYDDDVNCVYILAINAATTNNSSELDSLIKDLDKFARQGLYPADNVIVYVSRSTDSIILIMYSLFPEKSPNSDFTEG